MTGNTKVFFASILAILFCFQPSKGLAYATPYLFVVALVILRPNFALLRRLLVWTVAWFALGVFHFLIQRDFELQPFVLAFITYSSFVVLLIPNDFFEPSVFSRLQSFLFTFLSIQAVCAFIQAFYGYHEHRTLGEGNGDIVSGTMTMSVSNDISASNIMFVTAMIFIMLALYPVVSVRRKGYFRLCAGVVGILLATVAHAMIFATIAILLALLLSATPRQLKTISGPLLAIVLLGIPFILLVPSAFVNAGPFARQFWRGESPKAELFREALAVIPDVAPQTPFVGVGPGQFASRAAMISTGRYLGVRKKLKHIPLVDSIVPRLTGRYELPLFYENEAHRYFGSTQTPFSSWVSVSTEFGFVFMCLLTLAVGFMVFRLAITARSVTSLCRKEFFSLIAAIIFAFLLGFQENYWEMPQTIFVGLLLMRFLFESAKYHMTVHPAQDMPELAPSSLVTMDPGLVLP